MRLRKDSWFRAVVSELQARGFEPGGLACPNIVSSFCHNGVTIEIRGGRTLIVRRRGYERDHSGCDLAFAIKIIEEAVRIKG